MSTSAISRAELVRRRLAGRAAVPPPEPGIPVVERGGALPLSAAQRGLWALDRIAPGRSDYLMPVLLRFRGHDDAALRRALDELVARHEILRTRYSTADGEPVQLVDAPGPMPVEVLDLRGPDAEHAFADVLARAGELPFDLAARWPVRALLARLSDDETAVLVTLHHICSDGWTEDILVAELTTLVDAFAQGQPSPLPAPALHYADYAAWQHGQLARGALADHLEHWRTRLADAAPLALPTDRPRGPVRDTAGARFDFTIPEEVARPLTRLGHEHGATAFMVLLAAFQALLGRYTGQHDIVVGTPVAGRDRAETQQVVGLFANMVVLRTDLAGDPAFTELLGRTRDTALDAYAHQLVPFDRVVDALAVDRDPSRTPLFQVAFQLQAAPPTTGTGTGGGARRHHVGWSTAKFDLTLALAARQDGSLSATLEYAAALFDPATIERMAGHYATLLRGIAADPAARLSRLEVLTPAERAELAAWTTPRAAVPVGGSLATAFQARAALTPHAVAVTHEGEELTYADLNTRANRLAHRLRDVGAGPGTLVGVRLDRGLDLVVALLGVLKSGAGYLPLDPEQPVDRLAHILSDAGAPIVVDRGDLPGHEPGGGPIAVRPDDPGDWPGTDPDRPADPDEVAYVIYTSGSTGKPKGVPVTHRNVLRLLAASDDDFGFGPDDVWTLFHSCSFDFSVWELWGALLRGGRVVVVPFGVSRSPSDFLALLAAEGVTVLNQTPSAFRGLVEAAVDADLRAGDLALRVVVFGGEALDVAELEPWFERFPDTAPRLVNMYGITETTVHVTYRPVRAAEVGGTTRSPIGRALADLSAHVLDEHLNPVPVGVPGQVYVSGPGLARGYLGQPALTADRFGPDPFAAVPGQRMYRTGDLARRGPEGELEFLGRADDQVKIHGHRIEPGEVEAAAVADPAVDACAVLAHTRRGERSARLVAYVVPAAGTTFDGAALRESLGRTLPRYMVPARFIPVEAIPLTAHGKLDRKALPDPDAHRDEPAGVRVAPRTPVERVIAEAWAETLGVPEVSVHDNFFALGGDSIRAIRVVGSLRTRGVDLGVQDLLVHQTVDGLARFHANAAPSTTPNAEERRVAPFELLSDADRATLPDGLTDAYPLSMVQAAMVYQMLADHDESPYHNITLLPIVDDAPFSPTALRAAADLLAHRHEILRTSFDLASYREPLQLVHRTGTVEVGYDDLRGLDPDAAKDAVEAFTAEVRRSPFDISRAPMLRFHAHQTADDRWTFSLIECHAILDGWSHHSLITELMADYRAIRDGRTPESTAEETARPARYADFVAQERDSLASHADAEFWRDRLDRYDPVGLPAGWAAAQDSGERPYQVIVPYADLEPGLRRLAAAAGVPLKSVLFAAHLTALGVISGSRSFHTGLVTNGRLETRGGEAVRGMHLNTLPFGIDLTARTWAELAKRVFDEEVAGWPHRRFPLPEMQRRWGGGTPLVETAFTYLDFHVLDARRIESAEVVDVSPNEFALDVWTFPGRFFLSARPERVSRANGVRLATIYRRIVESMAADPRGDALGPVLDAGETALLHSFASGPAVPYPDLPVHELFERQVAATPSAVALRCPDGTEVTYTDLNARANRIGRRLRALGVGRESRVGVLLRRGPDLVAALLGVLKAGAAYLPLEPAHPAARLTALLADTGAAVVLTESALAGSVASADAAPLLLDREDLASQSPADLGPTATPDDLAYVVYTSGSTGTPKGVMIEHRNLVNYVSWCQEAYTPLGGTGAPLYSSMAFDLPVTSLYPALLTGQAVTLTADDGTANVDGLVAALRGGGFGLLKLTPSHLAVLDQALTAQDVRVAAGRLVAGGEELTRGMVSTWAEHAPDTVVDNEYGPTETTVGCSYLEGTAGGLAEGVLPIGRPISNTVMRVLDADFRMAPVGVVGELYIGGAQLARGYVGRPDLTAEKFVPDPYAAEPGTRLYRSGDLARYRADGVLEFAGRVDKQVKIRGYRIELGEVEAAVRAAAGLSEVVVRVRTAPGGGKDLVAYLVAAADAGVDAGAVRDRLARTLPAYLVPAAFVVLDALPLTANGKVDDTALAAVAAPTTGRYAPPRTAVENILVRAWSDALGVARVGVHDSFTDLGGHSLTVMRVIVRLREEHGIQLSFRDFYTHRTVEELARVVEGSSEDASDVVVWLRRGGSRPPLFCVHPGSAHWFAQLAAHLDPDQPVAAFEWPGLSRPCPAPGSVAEIAELNLAELRKIAPSGPYRLLGWCGGSQITSEMARRLREQGEEVTFVLLDPALDTFERENMREFMARFRRAEALLAALAEAAPEDVPELQRQAVEVLEVIVDDGTVDPPVPGDQFWPSRVRVWRELLQTRIDYRHRPYPGALELIAGDELAAGEHEVAFGQSFDHYASRWSELATGGLRVHRVAGTHLGVLRAPHVAAVAAILTDLMTPNGKDVR